MLIAVATVTLSVMLYIFGAAVVFVMTSAVFLVAIISFVLKRKFKNAVTVCAALLFVAAFGVYVCFVQTLTVDKVKELEGKSGTVTCHVTEEPEYKGDYVILQVKTDKDVAKNSNLCKNVNLSVAVLVDEDVAAAKIGDEITGVVTFKELDEAFKKSNYGRKIFVSATIKDATITGHKYTFYETAVKLRQAVRQKINQNFSGDSRGILNGVVLGDNSAMSDELYGAFKICGVIHVTAVSGLHIGVLCYAIITVLMLFLKKRTAYLVSLLPIFIVVAVTGFYPSAIRAGIMCAITFIGAAFFKKSDGLNSLGVSVILMLLVNPFYVCDLGFGLSCAATAGVIVATKIYNEYLSSKIKLRKKWLQIPIEAVLTVLIQSVGAVIFTLPLQILEFGFVSVVAPFSSVMICTAVSYALILAVPGIIVSFVPYASVVASVIFLIPKLFAKYIEVVILSLAKLPFSYLSFGAMWVILWMGFSLAFIGVWYITGKAFGKRFLCFAVAGLFIVSLFASSYSAKDVVEISSLKSEKGFCVVIYSGEKCVIIGSGKDGEAASAVYTELRLHGVRTVDALLLPNDSENVAGGALNLCDVLSLNVPSVTKTAGEVYHTLENVKIYAHPYDGGCYYEVVVYDKTIIVGAGGYAADISCDVLFSTRALPEIESSEVTVIAGNELNGDLSPYGRVYYSFYDDVSIKFAKGREGPVYGG